MTYIININEFTLFRLIGLGLLGCAPYVLAIDPLFPPLRRALGLIVNMAVKSGIARPIIDLCPEYQPIETYGSRILFYNIFADTEAWQNDYYDFAGADRSVPDYAYAYRHITCNYAKEKHFPYLLIAGVLDKLDGKDIVFCGLPTDTVSGLTAYWDRPFTSCVRPMLTPDRFINICCFLLVTAFAAGWVLSRVRRTRPAREFFFAADYIEDPRDIRLYQEVEEGGQILLVVRDPSRRIDGYDELRGYHACRPGDGCFGPKDALATLSMVVRDGARLLKCFYRIPPALYFRAAALPYRRARLRALFNRYHPHYFWGRDDYNVEHILRREELHRIGGVSLGLNHGYSHYSNHYSIWRYISFDRFYAFGLAQYNRYMKETWASDMTVIPSGSFGATRDDFSRRLEPKPRDIGVYVAAFVNEQGLIDLVRALAEAFPERTVWLRVKPNFVDTEDGQAFITACCQGLANVQHTREPLFDIFRKTTYAFSDPSTVVVEALQFGRFSFLTDVSTIQKETLYREFLGICVTSGKDAVMRIHNLENGTLSYHRDSYGELVDLSGRVFFDIIREDIGLAPKAEPVPLPDVA